MKTKFTLSTGKVFDLKELNGVEMFSLTDEEFRELIKLVKEQKELPLQKVG